MIAGYSSSSSPESDQSRYREKSATTIKSSPRGSDKSDSEDLTNRRSRSRSPRGSRAHTPRSSRSPSPQGRRSHTPRRRKEPTDAAGGANDITRKHSGAQQTSLQSTSGPVQQASKTVDGSQHDKAAGHNDSTSAAQNLTCDDTSSSHGPMKELDVNILQALGKRLTADKVPAAPVDRDIEVRWKEIYEKGLPKKEKNEIFKKYSQAQNCAFIEAPKLNPEVKACLPEPVNSRDTRLVGKQEKVAICLAALGSTLAELIKKESIEDLPQINLLSDCCRILVDLQRDESLTRRSLIIQNINPSMKDTLNATVIGEWLFGTHLEDKLKAAKFLERSSKDLKVQTKNPPKKQSKNSNYPPRQTRKPNNQQRSRQGSGSYKQRQPQSHYHKPQSTPDDPKAPKKKA